MTFEWFIFFAIGFIVTMVFFQNKKDISLKIVSPAPDTNPCGLHKWGRMEDIVPVATATEVTSILADRPELKDSLIQKFACSLICKQCGYIAGSQLVIHLDKWPDVVKHFVLVENEKAKLKAKEQGQ